MGAVRIHFTGEDLARIQVTEAPSPKVELVLSLRALRGRSNARRLSSRRRELSGHGAKLHLWRRALQRHHRRRDEHDAGGRHDGRVHRRGVGQRDRGHHRHAHRGQPGRHRDVAYTAAWSASGTLLAGADRRGGATADFWNGDLDDVVVYPRTLPATEIAGLYNNQRPLLLEPTATSTVPAPVNPATAGCSPTGPYGVVAPTAAYPAPALDVSVSTTDPTVTATADFAIWDETAGQSAGAAWRSRCPRRPAPCRVPPATTAPA